MGTSSAEIYRWVDEDGVVHFSDAPTQDHPGPIEEEATSSSETESGPDPQPAAKAPENVMDPDFFNFLDESSDEAAASQATIVEIYVTSWCRYCEKAKNFFRVKGIEFEVFDVERDARAARRMRSLTSLQAVPFVVINGQGITGYSTAEYERALQN